jgi:hypothetical protein
MTLEDRITSLALLGDKISTLTDQEFQKLADMAAQQNPWFISDSVKLALNGLGNYLSKQKLIDWLKPYELSERNPRRIGIVMAGNIPLVGFHDLLCVLISGHHAVVKLSSQDSNLLPILTGWLEEIEPRFKGCIYYEERLNKVDALIATGSDNTARYFEYYFRSTPHLIRKNRSSCAVLMGEENEGALTELGKDVFSYFGLGCRNVSKIYVPDDFDFMKMFRSWEAHKEIIHHHKYANNYDYQKSISLVNKIPFLDSGFVLLLQNENLVSPISVIYYESYTEQADLHRRLEVQQEKIQCVVSANGWFPQSIPFGKAQLPELYDYADRVDTMKFLSEI